MLALPQSEDSQPPIIRATVNMVNVLLTVRDDGGRYVQSLKQDDFEIYEDGVRQQIAFFSEESGADAQPLTIVLLLDTSGSIKDKLHFEKEAASRFLYETLRKNKDMAAVVQFDSEINLVQDFTYEYDFLEKQIMELRAGGATKLYDAIWLGVNDLLKHEVGRRVMVVISDGEDTQSVTTDKEAILAAQDTDVVIFGIGVRSARFVGNFGKLKQFARSTGGLFFDSKIDPRELNAAFAHINREIKNQYSLGYYSSNGALDGSFRELEIKVRRRGLKVNHREGYYAGKVDS